jgi:hypothetical protein
MHNLDDLNLEEGHEELQVNPYVCNYVCMYVCMYVFAS